MAHSLLMNLPNNGIVRIAGDADKPANHVQFAEDGSVTLSRAWSGEELAAFERIEKLYEGSIDSLKRTERVIQAAEREKTIRELESGKRVVLPKTKEHALAMVTVALAALKSLEPLPK
jgi:hypothetical protein